MNLHSAPVRLLRSGTASPGSILLVSALLSGCTWISKTEFDAQAAQLDQDGDGISFEDGDCDPEDGKVFPGAEEVWYDGIDADCAGDDDYDADQDGWVATEYDGLETRGVDGTGGLRSGDCDDANPDINPASVDIWYDGIDSDCAGNDDNDADSDGFASNDHGGDDCFDGDPNVYPGAAETWLDGKDSDCDGKSDYDQDEDGYAPNGLGNRATLYAPSAPVVPDGDCDDTDPDVNVGEDEGYYDDQDNDCSPLTADRDQDMDGFELGGVTLEDCDDEDASSYPGAVETVSDDIDHDCDGDPGTFFDADLAESGPLFDSASEVEFSGLYPLEVGAGPNYLWFAIGAEDLTLPLVTGEQSNEDAIVALGVPLSSSGQGFSRRQVLVDFPLDNTYDWGTRFGFHATTSPGSGGTSADLLLVGHSIHTDSRRMLRIGGYNDRTNQALGAFHDFNGAIVYDDVSVALGADSVVHVVGCVDGSRLDIVSGQLSGGAGGDLTTGVVDTFTSLNGQGTVGCAVDAVDDPDIQVSFADASTNARGASYDAADPDAGLASPVTYGSFSAVDVDVALESSQRSLAHVDSTGTVYVTDDSGTGEVSGVSAEGRVHILVTGDTRGTATPEYILSGVQVGTGEAWFAVGNNDSGYAVYDVAPATGAVVVDAAAWLDEDGRVHVLMVGDDDTLRYGTALY